MRVFKTYFKIVKAYILPIAIYIGVFLIIEVMTYTSGALDTSNVFDTQTIKVWYINEDETNEFTSSLLKYLDENTVLSEAGDRTGEQLSDAIYFRDTEYILTIPKGYAEKILNDEDVKLEVQYIDGSYSRVYVDNLIQTFIGTYQVYTETMPDLGTAEILSYMQEDLKNEISTELYQHDDESDKKEMLNQTFNMACYAIMGCLLMGNCFVMTSFNDGNIKRRTLCSPASETEYNTKINLANFMLGFLIYLLIMGIEYALAGKEIFSILGILLSVNLLIYAIVTVSLAMLVVYLFPKRDTQVLIANTLALGMAFLGGCFVPQSLMGDTVNSVAAFTPAHWFVKTTNALCQSVTLSDAVLKEAYFGYFVQFMFAAAFLAAALLVWKKRNYVKVYE